LVVKRILTAKAKAQMSNKAFDIETRQMGPVAVLSNGLCDE
jgi:hypothetical protein